MNEQRYFAVVDDEKKNCCLSTIYLYLSTLICLFPSYYAVLVTGFRLVPNMPSKTLFHAPDIRRSLYFVTTSLSLLNLEVS
jgi:hypothetical protein